MSSEPYLQHHDQFEQALANYHMSERARRSLEGLQLVLMVAPTSTGRNTVILEMVKSFGYYFIVSDTTRPPQLRDGKMEQNGVNYFFRSEHEMLADLQAGEFLEAELIHNQQVSGISIRELEKAKALHKIAVTDVDIGGIHNALNVKPDTISIMLLPPSFGEWQQRIAHRGRMTEVEIRRRLQTARAILTDGLQNHSYKFVIAEDVAQSAAIVDAIAHGKPNPYQGSGIGLIHHLQDSLEQKLSSNLV